MKMRRDQEEREILALVSWLQTFDEFPYALVDCHDTNDGLQERVTLVLESLENVKISW